MPTPLEHASFTNLGLLLITVASLNVTAVAAVEYLRYIWGIK